VRDEDGQPPHLLGRRQFLRLGAGAAALPISSRIARAQSYPSRPVRVIVGFAPGGTTDITARLMGQWLSERLGQQFVIENRTGAATNIATEAVVRAPADGYTLLLVTASNAINATLYDKLSFNFIRDIAPVAGIIRYPLVMQVNPSFPAKTVPEFISYAKSNPGKISYGSGGIGAVCRPWCCSVSRFVLRLRQVHCHRNREVGQGDQVLRGQGGLMQPNVP
jgi:tripartite-type tricarboxylate transporter receptor subunit TctC